MRQPALRDALAQMPYRQFIAKEVVESHELRLADEAASTNYTRVVLLNGTKCSEGPASPLPYLRHHANAMPGTQRDLRLNINLLTGIIKFVACESLFRFRLGDSFYDLLA
jgi:hypothetical protein